MNQLKNCVQLIGNLGQAPEVKDLNNGNKLARMPIATTETYRDKEGNRQESTHWHQIVGWGRVAENMENLLDKGSRVAVEGKLISRSYETNDGETRYITEVIVRSFLMLDAKKN